MAEVTVNGVRLVYESRGQGPVVLLVCGTGQSAATWELYQVPALVAAGYRVVTFDNRGMPPSDCPPAPYTVAQMVDDVVGLIEALGVGPCRLVGQSLGAAIAQEVALARPDLVEAAVLMGTFAGQDAFRATLFESWVEQDRLGIQLPPLSDAVAGALALFSVRALEDEAFVGQHLEFSLNAPPWTNPGRLGQHEADLAYNDRLDALRDVAVRCLVIAFGEDRIAPASRGREVAATIPGCAYAEIPGAGHAGPFEQPELVNQAIVEFLDARS